MRRIKRTFMAAGIILLVLLAAGYRNINRKIPPAVLNEARIGEQLEFQDGVMISVVSYRFLSDQEQEQLVAKMDREPMVGFKILEVKLTIENTTAENKKIIMTDLYVEGIGMGNGISKGIIDVSGDCYSSLQQELQPGESRQICFPYDILKNEIFEREWERIEEREFWLVFSSYPVKNKLLLS